jgi:WS/DGAT/MGAT family acyltransferase
MAAAYDPLPARDSAFLFFETPTTHMHLGGTAIFQAGPLATRDGGVDIDRIRAHIGSRLHLIPRYRQRLAWVPIEQRPVWVDDQHFNLAYHVRHTSLPRPGDEEQLKRLTGRINSQQLDRERPLWEAWIVEGLAGGRFALVVKTHHCMADGITAVELLTVLLTPNADEPDEPAPPWTPRPAAAGAVLLRDALLRRASLPLDVVRRTGRAIAAPGRTRSELAERLAAVWQTAGAGLPPPADTPLNRPIGPHRHFDWVSLDLGEAKAIKNRLGGTVNDVVLTTVAGGMARFLGRRGVATEGLNYRVVVPVNVRAGGGGDGASNRASGWLMSLPVGTRDPRRRLAEVHATTSHLKASKQALGPESLLQVVELAGPLVFWLGVRLTSRLSPYNLIVTNVPGPPVPLYMLGAPLVAGYPLAPLFEHQGVAIAIFSHLGQLSIGINADWDLVPDLPDLAADLEASFRELREAALGMPAARASG